MASEVNDGTRLNESRIKALTGGDSITARFLYAELFTFVPVAKFWLSVNHKPVVRDDSFGFWRRIRLVPFERRFSVDRHLSAALRDEAAGILSWAVRGCLDWRQHGLMAPDVVTAATAAYEQESDPLAAFLDDACECKPTPTVRAGEFYKGYERWAVANGLAGRERLSQTAFGTRMKNRFKAQKDTTGTCYVGVTLR
jgi:putative DNA primase/helicase